MASSVSFGLGERITIELEGNGQVVNRAVADRKSVVLLLNDVPFRGLCTNAFIVKNPQVTDATKVPPITSPGTARLQFALQRNDSNKADWTVLLGSPRNWDRDVRVGIGMDSNNAVTLLGQIDRQQYDTKLVLLPHSAIFARKSTTWGISAGATWICAVVLLLAMARDRDIGRTLERWWWWLVVLALLAGVYLSYGLTWCWAVFFILFLTGFFYLAAATEALRDSGPKPSGGKLRPFSLARTQMAIWFFLIISAYVFLWLVANAFDSVTSTALALMGIGAGTALGAEVQNSGKTNQLKAERQQLESKAQCTPTKDCLETQEERLKRFNAINQSLAEFAVEKTRLDAVTSPTTEQQNRLKEVVAKLAVDSDLQKEKTQLEATIILNGPLVDRIREIDKILNRVPESQGFFSDVLADEVGISFHRFQMFVWTVVLAIIFVDSVYRGLAMPDFSATLLALMGISSGTYLGFMIAEPRAAAPATR